MKSLYLVLFAACAIGSAALTLAVRTFATRFQWALDSPNGKRRMHSKPIPRVGGIAVYATFMSGLILAVFLNLLPEADVFRLKWIAGTATIIFLLGLWDDLHPLSPMVKFSVQGSCAVLLYLSGVRITHIDLLVPGDLFRPVASMAATVFWILLITNAFNLIDGLDGLSAGSAFFSTITILVVSMFHALSTASILAVVLAGAILGFLRFNFNPASVFLGDCGSLFIGFVLSAMAIAWSEKSSAVLAVSIPVLSFGVPILDVLLAMVRRFLRGDPLFRPDADHIHHKLIRRGLSQQSAVFVLYAMSLGFGALSILVTRFRVGTPFVVAAVFVVAAMILFGVLGYPEFNELKRLVYRAFGQKQVIANNLRMRRVEEQLKECKTSDEISLVLQSCFEGVGFDLIRLELKDRIWVQKLGLQHDEQFRATSEPEWQIRMRIAADDGAYLGVLSLCKFSGTLPQLVDGNSLAESGLGVALVNAIRKVSGQEIEADPPTVSRAAIGVRFPEELLASGKAYGRPLT